MRPVYPRALRKRLPVWAFALALLLKAAMPFLAQASAQLQGKTLVEVCSVYGVSLVPLGGASHDPQPGHDSAHGDTHCALNACAVLASGGEPALPALPLPMQWGSPPRTHASSQAPDASATWVARLQHGPPTLT